MTTVCLTFDFDAVSLWLSSFKQTGAGALSRGEYGANVGLGRILELLERKRVQATFFVPAHTAASFPTQVRDIVAAGHEVALHGYCHESPVALERAEEADLLDRMIEKVANVIGGDFQPRGYRSPAWDLSGNTIELLEERGILYDSSLMGDDFTPYLASKGGRIDEEAFDPGQPSKVVEIPVAWELDDFPYFSFLNRPLYSGLRSPREVFDIWRGEFDYCHSLGDGVFTLTMHPQVIGRGPRIAILDELIDHMSAADDVSFQRVVDEAERLRPALLPAT